MEKLEYFLTLNETLTGSLARFLVQPDWLFTGIVQSNIVGTASSLKTQVEALWKTESSRSQLYVFPLYPIWNRGFPNNKFRSHDIEKSKKNKTKHSNPIFSWTKNGLINQCELDAFLKRWLVPFLNPIHIIIWGSKDDQISLILWVTCLFDAVTLNV